MSKRTGEIEVKIDVKDSFVGGYIVPDDIAKELYKEIKKDNVMKVLGTYTNNKVVLDAPVDYVGVFDVNDLKDKRLGLKNGLRYEFEVKTSMSAKPQIIRATVVENEYGTIENPSLFNDSIVSIFLNGNAISNFKPQSKAEPVAVKAVVTYVPDIEGFQVAHDNFVKPAIENGSIQVFSGKYSDCVSILADMNSEPSSDKPIALFYMEYKQQTNTLGSQSKQQNKDGLFVGDFYLQPDLVPLLKPFELAIQNGERFSFLLTGEAGYGKTSAYKAIAEHLNLDLLYVDCSVMLNTTDWFGIMQAKKGNTSFETTPFVEYLERGNCLIVLDEFNRLSIEVANSLLPILDDRGFINVKNRTITAGKGIMFGITLNEGIEYTGIGGMLDKAVKSRIYGKVEVKPLPFDIETEVINRIYHLEPDISEKIVNVMVALREVVKREKEQMNFMSADVSTRTTKMIAWWVKKGLDINDALQYALFNFVSDDEKTMFVNAIKVKGIL